MKTSIKGLLTSKILIAHHFELPGVLQGGDALEAWAMTPIVTLKRAVGIKKDEAFFLVFRAKITIYVFLD
jgi:hypothetical protein